jgi:putative ABC transport system substrate-binding protein
MHSDLLKRREFITLLGGAAAWPLAARAQQAEQMRRIGVLGALTSDDPEVQARMSAFLQGLQQLGWTVGRNVQIEYRWAGGSADDIRKYAAELVSDLTSSCVQAVRLWRRCCRRPAPFPSCSRTYPTQSALASSTA